MNFLKIVTPLLKGLLKAPCLTQRLAQDRSRALHFKSSIFMLSSYSGGKNISKHNARWIQLNFKVRYY